MPSWKTATRSANMLPHAAPDRAAVEAFQRDDPLVAADIWERVEVRAFAKRLDNWD